MILSSNSLFQKRFLHFSLLFSSWFSGRPLVKNEAHLRYCCSLRRRVRISPLRGGSPGSVFMSKTFVLLREFDILLKNINFT